MNISGTVTNLRKNAGTSKAGKPYTIHFITVDAFGEEINVGFKNDYPVGSVFASSIEKNKFGDWIPIVYGSSGGSSAPPPAAKASGGGYGGGIRNAKYPVPADDPQNIIINQNSMAHAVAIATAVAGLDATSEDVLNVALKLAPKIAAFSSGRLTQEALAALNAESSIGLE